MNAHTYNDEVYTATGVNLVRETFMITPSKLTDEDNRYDQTERLIDAIYSIRCEIALKSARLYFLGSICFLAGSVVALIFGR